MSKIVKDIDNNTVHVYSDDGEKLWSYNINHPNMRFGIEKEKVIGGYKMTVNDDWSCTMIYVGSDTMQRSE